MERLLEEQRQSSESKAQLNNNQPCSVSSVPSTPQATPAPPHSSPSLPPDRPSAHSTPNPPAHEQKVRRPPPSCRPSLKQKPQSGQEVPSPIEKSRRETPGNLSPFPPFLPSISTQVGASSRAEPVGMSSRSVPASPVPGRLDGGVSPSSSSRDDASRSQQSKKPNDPPPALPMPRSASSVAHVPHNKPKTKPRISSPAHSKSSAELKTHTPLPPIGIEKKRSCSGNDRVFDATPDGSQRSNLSDMESVGTKQNSLKKRPVSIAFCAPLPPPPLPPPSSLPLQGLPKNRSSNSLASMSGASTPRSECSQISVLSTEELFLRLHTIVSGSSVSQQKEIEEVFFGIICKIIELRYY